MPPRLLPLLLAAALLLGLLSARAARQDSIRPVPVAGQVFLLEGGRGGNMAVMAGPDGLLLVDDQFADLSDPIRSALASLDRGALKFVLNTHFHGDHTGGNAGFGREALILAHDAVRRRLREGSVTRSRKTPPAPPEALPVVTYGDRVTLHFNGESVDLIHFPDPAHTDGDSVVWFRGSGVVHMGDLYFNGMFPFIDLENGGSVSGLIRTLESIVSELPDAVRLVPGHGSVGGRSDLEAYLGMLKKTLAFVQARRAAGRSLAQIQEEGLPAAFDAWGGGFIKPRDWIATLWQSLEAGR